MTSPAITITLAIAGITIAFRTKSATMARAVKRRYRGYLTPRARPCLTFECTFSAAGAFPSRSLAVVTRDRSGWWRAVRRDFDCRFTTGGGEGRLRPSIYSFDACLRVIIATILPVHGGVLVHAAAAAKGGAACVFAGRSGSGKSTIARLVNADCVLNDEICAVVVHGGRVEVWGTPFWGEMGTGPSYPRPWSVASLLFLVKSRVTRKQRIGGSDALKRLLRCVCAFSGSGADTQRALDIAVDIVASVPSFGLHFEKKPLAWDLVTSPQGARCR